MSGDVAGARDLMQRSRQADFAVGAFNVDNQETVISVAGAAQAKRAPVLVEVSHGEVEVLGLRNLRSFVDDYRAELDIEMRLNLDHSPSVEAATAGIDVGFEFVPIDYSQAKKDGTDTAIIEAVRAVVGYATRSTSALVESEPHYVGGSSNVYIEDIDYAQVKRSFSTPDSARRFVEATGIDTLAAAVGNLHGRYAAPNNSTSTSWRKSEAPSTPTSVSTVAAAPPATYFQQAAKTGVSKININSDLRYAYCTTLERQLRSHPDEYAPSSSSSHLSSAPPTKPKQRLGLGGQHDSNRKS